MKFRNEQGHSATSLKEWSGQYYDYWIEIEVVLSLVMLETEGQNI